MSITRTKKLIIGGTAVLAVMGGAWSLRPIPSSQAGIIVEAPREVVAPGSVQASADPAALSFEAEGRVAEVLVKEGQAIERGQVLARLDDRLARSRVARAEASLAAARARLDQLQHGSRPEEIRQARGELESARARQRDAERRFDQDQRLLASRSIAQAEADEARENAASARALADASEARSVLVEKGPRIEARREAEAQLLGAQAELEETRALLDHTVIRAPISGVILRRNVEVGEHLVTTPPKAVLTVVDPNKLEVRAELDEADVGRVEPGTRGFATADAYPGRRLTGRVTRVLGELGRKALRVDDPRARVDTRILEVIFTLDQEQAIPLGLRMDVHLATR